MTREERKKAIEVLDDMKVKIDIPKAAKTQNDRNWALDVAIKALSQEPCDDAISRKDAEQMFRNIRSHLKPQDYKSAEEFNTRDLMLLNAEQMIHALPSVTQKSGKWINDECGNVICSECKRFRRDCRFGHTNYCNHCGVRMYEPQESEEEE